MKSNDRLKALLIIIKLLEKKIPLTHLLQEDKNLTPFTKALCFGVCRHYFRLEALAEELVQKKPKQEALWVLILLGLYQLHYLAKPDYVTVKETVALADSLNLSWAKALINAVLRRFCLERETILQRVENKAKYVHGLPNWLLSRLKEDWPDNWEKIAHASDIHPPMSLRVNRRHKSREAYLEDLERVGFKASILPYSDYGLVLEKPSDVHFLPEFYQGSCSVQDEGAQLALNFMQLNPGLRVLDACAAPGGKTCHMLEAEPGLAELVALDIEAKRLARLKENLARLKLKATVLEGSALSPETWWDGKPFDRILLDAPCSATGIIRRHPDIKLLRTQAEVDDLVLLQAKLLKSLWPLLKPQGLLIYATCSILKEENEKLIAQFLLEEESAQFKFFELGFGLFTGHGWQLLPGQFNTDGFFYSVLEKKA